MTFQSVLFERGGEPERQGEPACFADLHLDQIVAAVIANRDGFELEGFFHQPLHDVDAVRYRQLVMRDLERDEVRERVVEFGRGMARMRECLAIAARAPSPVAGEHRIARRRGEANVVADNRLRFGRMESGKLDEEQARMSDIVDHISANAMLLCNESFSSTNEREGSQIAREVITALVESDITVLLVTHMFDLANGFYERRLEDALFLRAERGSDGARSFKISEGRPLPTSYGEDSYRKAFGRDATHPADARTDAQRSASRG